MAASSYYYTDIKGSTRPASTVVPSLLHVILKGARIHITCMHTFLCRWREVMDSGLLISLISFMLYSLRVSLQLSSSHAP